VRRAIRHAQHPLKFCPCKKDYETRWHTNSYYRSCVAVVVDEGVAEGEEEGVVVGAEALKAGPQPAMAASLYQHI